MSLMKLHGLRPVADVADLGRPPLFSIVGAAWSPLSARGQIKACSVAATADSRGSLTHGRGARTKRCRRPGLARALQLILADAVARAMSGLGRHQPQHHHQHARVWFFDHKKSAAKHGESARLKTAPVFGGNHRRCRAGAEGSARGGGWLARPLLCLSGGVRLVGGGRGWDSAISAFPGAM